MLSSRITLALLFILISATGARRPVSVSPNCVNLLPGVLEQAYGFDLTDFNPSRVGPNFTLPQKPIQNPFLTYSCDADRTFTVHRMDPKQTREYQIPDQLQVMSNPVGSFRSVNRCYATSEEVEKRVLSDVQDWERDPIGSFVSTNAGSFKEFLIPTDARCVTEEMISIYQARTDVTDNYYFNDTHPNLDADFQQSLKSLGNPLSPTELIREYGTSFWNYGYYGTNIHVYVLTSDFVENRIMSALDSFETSAESRVEKWIQDRVDGLSTVFVRQSCPGRWSSESTCLIAGSRNEFGSMFSVVENEEVDAAVSDYLKKGGFEQDWRGDWEHKS